MYVKRDQDGNIDGWSRQPDAGYTEIVADDGPEMAAYRLKTAKGEKQMEMETRARAIAAARLPTDLLAVVDGAKTAIDGCTSEAELAALAEPAWPK